MPPPTVGSELGHTAFNVLSMHDQALAWGADHKAFLSVQQGFQQCFSNSALVHGPDARALRLRPDQIEGGQDFRVLPGELRASVEYSFW
jgi:hypothetical protein